MSSANSSNNQSVGTTVVNSIVSLIYLAIMIFAFYLAFKCNGGFEILSFLAAFCCPFIYIPYVLATRGLSMCGTA